MGDCSRIARFTVVRRLHLAAARFESQPEAPIVGLTGVEGRRIADLPIHTPGGQAVPIRVVADVRREMGANMILRENVQRRIVVSSNVAGGDLGSVVRDIQAAVAAQVPMPNGYHVEYGGQFESQQRASERLLMLGAAAIAGVFMKLVLAFGRARDALLVMVNLPLALIGGSRACCSPAAC